MSESSKPFRIAFIGCGAVAQRHMQHLKNVAGAQVVAVADVSDWWLEKTKKDFAVPRLFKDYRQMLREMPEIDAIDVCTPNSLHAPHTIEALEAGKHVMVEKPMAMNAAEAQRMLDASKRAGRQLVVGFQHRFEAKSKMLRDRIASGEFGKILYVRCQALRRRGIPTWGPFGKKEVTGGGPMIDFGVHLLETAHYLMGSPRPTSVFGGTFTSIGNQPPAAAATWGPWDHTTYTVEDLAVAMVRFDTGAMLSIETSFAAHIEQDVWSITVVGEKAGACWESSRIFKDEAGHMVSSKVEHLPQWDYFEYKMRHFVEVCRDGRSSEVPPEHGVMVQKIIDGLYASAEKQREVMID